MATPHRLTNLQRELLDLFALDLSEAELHDVKRLLARHFAERATEGFETYAAGQGLSVADTDAWASEHHRRPTTGGPTRPTGR